MSAIRILHLSSSDVFGGNEEHIRVCAKYANPDVMNVSVACPEGDFSDVLQTENIRWFSLEMASKFSFSCAIKIAKTVRENHIDIVHSHNRRTDYFAYLSSYFCKPHAFVTTVHDRVDAGASAMSGMFHARLLRLFFTHIFCVSQRTREQVISFSKCLPENVSAIVNGTDLSRLNIYGDVASKKTELNLPQDKTIVGMMARMRDANFEKKAHPVFLRAAAEVLRKRQDVIFTIAGESAIPRLELQKLCEELSISPHVVFLGPRKYDSLDVMACYDIFVLPSSYEGLPRTLSEVMCLGKAVVATKVDGVPELVRDDENGILVPAGNHQKMAEAILDYLEHPQKISEFGARAKEYLFANFSHEKMASQFEMYYAQLTGETVKGNA